MSVIVVDGVVSVYVEPTSVEVTVNEMVPVDGVDGVVVNVVGVNCCCPVWPQLTAQAAAATTATAMATRTRANPRRDAMNMAHPRQPPPTWCA